MIINVFMDVGDLFLDACSSFIRAICTAMEVPVEHLTGGLVRVGEASDGAASAFRRFEQQIREYDTEQALRAARDAELVETFMELARENREQDFRDLARMIGIPAEGVSNFWEGTRQRIPWESERRNGGS